MTKNGQKLQKLARIDRHWQKLAKTDNNGYNLTARHKLTHIDTN